MELSMRAWITVAFLVSAPALADDGGVAAGEASYKGSCSVCHGKAADGQGPAGAAMNPKPTDFTDASWWAGKTDSEIKAIIKNGKPMTPMNSFAHLSDAEIANLIAFLKTKKPTE